MEWIFIRGLIYGCCGCDALRDKWIYRRPDIGWWQWHVVKWFGWLLPIAVMEIYFMSPWWIWIMDAIICRIIWRSFYSGRLMLDFWNCEGLISRILEGLMNKVIKRKD